jgi:hypothetical protein
MRKSVKRGERNCFLPQRQQGRLDVVITASRVDPGRKTRLQLCTRPHDDTGASSRRLQDVGEEISGSPGGALQSVADVRHGQTESPEIILALTFK